MSVSEFIKIYFQDPITYGTGYNPVNTTFYAMLFLFLVDGTIKTLKRFDIKMSRFLNAFTPYIFLGGVMRTLTDAGVYPQNFVFVTPGIYMLMLSLSFIDTFFNIPLGWVLLAVNLTGIMVKNNAPSLVLLFGSIATVLSIYLFNLLKFKLKPLEVIAILAHMMDAASTFVAIDLFGYTEQHVVANSFISLFGTAAVMFPLKLVALFIIIESFRSLINTNTGWRGLSARDSWRFLLWVVIAVGLGPGIRNTLSVAMGV